MLLHLENNPNLVSIFVASEKGSFDQVQNMRKGMIIANRVPPSGAKFNFWVVDRSNETQATVLTAPAKLAISLASAAKITQPAKPAGTPVNKPGGIPTRTRDGTPVNSVFTFFKDRNAALDTFVVGNNYDPRERPYYKNLAASVTGATPSAGSLCLYR